MKGAAKEFITSDVYLASAISLILNTQPTFKVENGRTIFVYPGDDDVYRAATLFNSGIAVDAYQFVEKIKRMRAEMLLRRQQG